MNSGLTLDASLRRCIIQVARYSPTLRILPDAVGGRERDGINYIRFWLDTRQGGNRTLPHFAIASLQRLGYYEAALRGGVGLSSLKIGN